MTNDQNQDQETTSRKRRFSTTFHGTKYVDVHPVLVLGGPGLIVYIKSFVYVHGHA